MTSKIASSGFLYMRDIFQGFFKTIFREEKDDKKF